MAAAMTQKVRALLAGVRLWAGACGRLQGPGPLLGCLCAMPASGMELADGVGPSQGCLHAASLTRGALPPSAPQVAMGGSAVAVATQQRRQVRPS